MPTWLTPQAAKFWVGAATAVVVAVLTALGDRAPSWLTVLAAVLGALGVYLTPNAAPVEVLDLPEHDEDEDVV